MDGWVGEIRTFASELGFILTLTVSDFFGQISDFCKHLLIRTWGKFSLAEAFDRVKRVC